MNLKLSLMSLSTALIMALPVTASADAPQNYWGIGVDGLDLETVADGTELDMNGFNLRYGFWFPFDLIGIEIRVGNVAEQTDTLIGDAEVRYALGMAKANLPLETVSLYVMGGISKSYYDFAGTEDDEEDIVAGVGIELLGTETMGLTIEFLKYGMDDDPREGK
jgi:hypothetical protein